MSDDEFLQLAERAGFRVGVWRKPFEGVRDVMTPANASPVIVTDELRRFAALSQPTAEPPARVTRFNVGAKCLSEDECIAQGIDFAAYERGIADASDAFDGGRP